jgi:hypothetical protein
MYELGICIAGGMLDPENMERRKREREQGLWVWDWYSYESELKFREIEPQIIANMDPRQRQALGWE